MYLGATFVLTGLETLGSFLDHHQGSISVIFAGVVAVATVAYAVLTRSLVAETRALRKVETEPSLAVYLTPNQRAGWLLDIVIQNTGRAEARNIRWKIDADIASLKERHILVLPEITLFKQGLASLAPGQQIRSFFGSAHVVLAEPILKPIQITASYEYGDHKRGKAFFLLVPEEYWGMQWISETPVEKSLEELVKLLKSMTGSRLSHPFSVLHVATVAEEHLDEEARKNWYNDRLPQPSLLWRLLQTVTQRLRAFLD
jgi:hypothetical protein